MSSAVDPRLAQVPVQIVPMSAPVHGGETPMREGLGMISEPVVSVIGKPIAGTSDFGVDGLTLYDDWFQPPPSQTLVRIKAVVFAVLAVGCGFVGGAVAFSFNLPAAIAVALIAGPATFYLTLVMNKPKRGGESFVVGERGLQVGILGGTSAERMVFAFDDASEAWLESTVRSYLVAPGTMKAGVHRAPHSGPPSHFVRTLGVIARDDHSVTWRADGAIDPSRRNTPLNELQSLERVMVERFLVFSEAYERMRVTRCEQALAHLRAMKPLELPAVDGRSVFITPSSDGALHIEVRKHGEVIFRPASDTVELREGRYTFFAGDRREVIERADLGDAFLLDLLLLNRAPIAIPTTGSLSRNAILKELLGK